MIFMTRDYANTHAKKEVENLISACQSVGVDVIEVCFSKLTANPPKLHGFEIPVMTVRGGTTLSSQFNSSVNFVCATVNYYPDKSGRCWAYIPATEKNIYMIKRSFAQNWFWIVDKEWSDKLKSEAKEEGLPIDPVGGVLTIKRNRREIDLEKSNNRLEDEIAFMKKKLENLENEKQTALERLKKEKERRLSGVTIKDRKQAIENIEKMKESINAD